MRKWVKFFLVVFWSLFGLWVLTSYFEQFSSPLYAQSQWIKGVETTDAKLVSKWSRWNDQPLREKDAEAIIQMLHQKPEWKVKIYQEIQRQSVSMALNGEGEDKPWFHMEKQKGEPAYTVKIPSFTVEIESDYPDRIKVNMDNEAKEVEGSFVGPLIPVDHELNITLETDLGKIAERKILSLEEFWGREGVRIKSTMRISSYQVESDSEVGEIYVDGKYIGNLEDSALVGPLPYHIHQFFIQRDLPWGTITSPAVMAEPDESTIAVPFPLVNERLLQEVGNTLVSYNLGWEKAVKNKDPIYLNSVHPELFETMSKIISVMNHTFEGYFVQVLLFPTQIEVYEYPINQYIVKAVVREDYMNGGWTPLSGKGKIAYGGQQFWQYTLVYSEEEGWLITDFQPWEKGEQDQKEKDALEVYEAIYFYSPEVLRIGVDAGYPPFEYVDGNNRLTGFDIELMSWLAEEIGMKVLWFDRPRDQVAKYLEQGVLDGIISALEDQQEEVEEKNEESFISIPYLELEEQILIMNPKIKGDDWERKIKKIGILAQSPSLEHLQTWGKENGKKVISFNGVKEGYDALVNRSIDGLVIFPFQYSTINQKGDLQPNFYTWEQLSRKTYVIHIRKERSDLTEEIYEVLFHFRTERAKEYEELKEKYFPSLK